MTGALIILAFTIAIGIILYLLDRRHKPASSETAGDRESGSVYSTPSTDEPDTDTVSKTTSEETQECCGLHLVCEKELTAFAKGEILYYDDEELDRFAGRDPEDYDSSEIEEFRDVMMTLLPIDVAGWARSLDNRGIRPPAVLRDELLMMVREAAGD